MATEGDKSPPSTEPLPQANKLPENRASESASSNSTKIGSPKELSHEETHHPIFQSNGAFFSWLATCIVGLAALCLFLTQHHIFSSAFKPGEMVDRDLVATRAALVVDDAATAQEQLKARQRVMPVFKRNSLYVEPNVKALNQLLLKISELQQSGLSPLPDPAVFEPRQHLNLLNMDSKAFTDTLSPTADYLNTEKQTHAKVTGQLEKASNEKRLNRQMVANQIKREREVLQDWKKRNGNSEIANNVALLAISLRPSEVQSFVSTILACQARMCHCMSRFPGTSDNEVEQIAYEYLPDTMPPIVRHAGAFLMASTSQPNMEVDQEATEEKLLQAAAAVKPVMKHIDVGQLIIRKNTVLTKEQVESLQSIGVHESNRWPLVLSLCLSLAAAAALIGLFLYAYEPQHLFSTSSVALMFTLSIFCLSLAVAIGRAYPQFVPLPAVALLLRIFQGPRVAGVITFAIIVFLAVDGLVDPNNLIALTAAAGSAIVIYRSSRNSLMASGLFMAVAQAVFFFLAHLVTGHGHGFRTILPVLFSELGGGLTSAIVAIGALPFLESIFGLVTPFRLAEMTDATQPLLRRLEENAPGTYQHSLAVANLAEAGARAIKGDVNLVRAGAMYHDVGKMVRPRYFIENQLGDINPHDSMTPEESRARVLAHVTDGIALAKEYKLPKAVQDFIPMHQGTSLMAYFYHKACVRDGAHNVDPLFYRYPGPKPQSKETAIVMLADVSEAVTHSMHDPTQDEVEQTISKVFQNRWDDGQFTESGLSYHELEQVKKAFAHVWRTLHHERLKYPSTTTGRMAVPPSAVPPAPSSGSSMINSVSPAPASSSPLNAASSAQSSGSNAVNAAPASSEES